MARASQVGRAMSPVDQLLEQSDGGPTGRPDNENLRRALRLSRAMIALADDGDRDQQDPSCAILYGLLRDMAYKLRRVAEDECARHRQCGRWDAGESKVESQKSKAGNPAE